MMRVAKPRTARLLAAVGAASAVFAMIGSPAAVADPSDLICSNGELAMDGTCVPPDNTSSSMELPDGSASDVVPSNDSSPGTFDNSGAPSEAYLSERGY